MDNNNRYVYLNFFCIFDYSLNPLFSMIRTFREWFKTLGIIRISLVCVIVLLSIFADPSLSFFSNPHASIESQLLEKFQQQIPDRFGSILLIVYQLSGVKVTGVLVLAILCFFALKRFWSGLICLVVGNLGILLIVDEILKPWFNRTRPYDKFILVGGPRFPSGHAAGSVVFYFMSCTLLTSHYPRLRRPLFITSSVWVVLIWLSTLYSRAHWPSDIIAGAVVGYVWLSFCLAGLTVWDRYLRPKTKQG